jgi:nucleoside-diphosphate kinase
VGLKMVKAKLVQVSDEIASKHYPDREDWLNLVGRKSLEDFTKYNMDPVEVLGTAEPMEIGKLILKFNKEYLMSGPVLALVFEGPHAIELVRKLAGATNPITAPPGTIRGDFCTDSALLSDIEKRSIYNLVHASGDKDEAAREIELWFGKV